MFSTCLSNKIVAVYTFHEQSCVEISWNEQKPLSELHLVRIWADAGRLALQFRYIREGFKGNLGINYNNFYVF